MSRRWKGGHGRGAGTPGGHVTRTRTHPGTPWPEHRDIVVRGTSTTGTLGRPYYNLCDPVQGEASRCHKCLRDATPLMGAWGNAQPKRPSPPPVIGRRAARRRRPSGVTPERSMVPGSRLACGDFGAQPAQDIGVRAAGRPSHNGRVGPSLHRTAGEFPREVCYDEETRLRSVFHAATTRRCRHDDDRRVTGGARRWTTRTTPCRPRERTRTLGGRPARPSRTDGFGPVGPGAPTPHGWIGPLLLDRRS
ncbi:hypothetical protein GGD89_001051 [Roseospira visakhapatnamensis]|uniref:Uncharacterized protein n=1 Tax=Roseospira visakhapatnamensis TaxID=390880 RepID=A0A7W6RBK3_9PROT|nr:hypothetical protein [Roseospira visakhapatnamensis]